LIIRKAFVDLDAFVLFQFDEKLGKSVVAYITVMKRTDNRLYLQPLTGFSVDQKDSKISLENSHMTKSEWKGRNIALTIDYT
jgi:hypothetical protein